jgi:hypothetical protein
LNAEIRLTYRTSRDAEAVAAAVSPDNVRVPSGLSIRTISRRNRVFTEIQCDVKFETFIATIDDLLEAVSVADKSVAVVKKR